MPQVVAGWLITAAGVSATGVAAGLISAGVSLAFSYAVGKLFAPKGPRSQEVQNEIRQSDAPMIRYLGVNRASGVVHFYDWKRIGWRRRLFKLIAVSAGGITEIHQWWLNDKIVLVAPSGDVTTRPFDGRVTLNWRSGWGPQVYGGRYQTLMDAAPEWTMDHRLTEVGTILAAFDAVKAEDIMDTYPAGDPSVTVLFSGDRCMAPDGVTHQSTRNLAWQLFDIFTHPRWGIGTRDDIDLAMASQAIADCNDVLPGRQFPTVPRYRGGHGYRLNEPIKDIAERWLEAMAGSIVITSEGKIGIRAGKWREPRYTITEDKIVRREGGAGSGDFEVVTTLLPKYVAPETDWQDTHSDPWDDPVGLARYGEVMPKEFPLPVVQDHWQAKRLAKIKAAKLNPRWRFDMKLRFWGILLMEEEMVYVNLPSIGIINEPFWIDYYGENLDSEDGPVSVKLIHARRESLDWTAAEEGEPPGSAVTISHDGPPEVVTVTDFEIVNDDGPPFIRVAFSYPVLRSFVAQYRRSDSSDPWTTMTAEGTGGVARTLSLEDRGEYDIRYALRKSVFSETPDGEWQYINGIEVFENTTPPDAPEVVSASGTAGGALTITFRPDLGVNYALTNVYRGTLSQTWNDVRTGAPAGVSYAMQDVVIAEGTVPVGGARYWLQSQNASGFVSPPVLALEVPA